MKYFIKTFGCQQNLADSERIAGDFENQRGLATDSYRTADIIVINTCTVRQKADDKLFGLMKNIKALRRSRPDIKIILTGCLVGTAIHDKTGKIMAQLKKRLPDVDEFLATESISTLHQAVRHDKKHAWVPISNGCNNFCSFCIVPLARGREVSRPWMEVVTEIEQLAKNGYRAVTLLGQNVNSYGADLIKNKNAYRLPDGSSVKPIIVAHLGRQRIPTLFPHLLEHICQIPSIEKIYFIASNPWDFSRELISVMKNNPKIDRIIHLPVQSGNNSILRRMNRWHTAKQYLALLEKIRRTVPNVQFSTDIIVGFPGETKKAFQDTVMLAKKAKFMKAFIACYSPRPNTLAAKKFKDDVPATEKKRRFRQLDKLINHHYSGPVPIWLKPDR
jgi:tRNA-2-methylthio-N6-dimethylallyladenosine synthase